MKHFLVLLSVLCAYSCCTVLSAELRKVSFPHFGVKCPSGGKECPTGNTCCPAVNGGWNCCPSTDAVCCSDKIHCCPQGYKCTLSGGNCVSESDGSVIPWLDKQDSLNVAMNFDLNICPDGKSQCDSGQTCCPSMDGGYSCCAMANAVCCQDELHCCPSGYTCYPDKGNCQKSRLFSVPMTNLYLRNPN